MMPFFIFNFRKLKLRLLIEGVPDLFLICLGKGPKKKIHAEDKLLKKEGGDQWYKFLTIAYHSNPHLFKNK